MVSYAAVATSTSKMSIAWSRRLDYLVGASSTRVNRKDPQMRRHIDDARIENIQFRLDFGTPLEFAVKAEGLSMSWWDQMQTRSK